MLYIYYLLALCTTVRNGYAYCALDPYVSTHLRCYGVLSQSAFDPIGRAVTWLSLVDPECTDERIDLSVMPHLSQIDSSNSLYCECTCWSNKAIKAICGDRASVCPLRVTSTSTKQSPISYYTTQARLNHNHPKINYMTTVRPIPNGSSHNGLVSTVVTESPVRVYLKKMIATATMPSFMQSTTSRSPKTPWSSAPTAGHELLQVAESSMRGLLMNWIQTASFTTPLYLRSTTSQSTGPYSAPLYLTNPMSSTRTSTQSSVTTPSYAFMKNAECLVNDWTSWSRCDRPCEVQSKTRTRTVQSTDLNCSHISLEESLKCPKINCFKASLATERVTHKSTPRFTNVRVVTTKPLITPSSTVNQNAAYSHSPMYPQGTRNPPVTFTQASSTTEQVTHTPRFTNVRVVTTTIPLSTQSSTANQNAPYSNPPLYPRGTHNPTGLDPNNVVLESAGFTPVQLGLFYGCLALAVLVIIALLLAIACRCNRRHRTTRPPPVQPPVCPSPPPGWSPPPPSTSISGSPPARPPHGPHLSPAPVRLHTMVLDASATRSSFHSIASDFSSDTPVKYLSMEGEERFENVNLRNETSV